MKKLWLIFFIACMGNTFGQIAASPFFQRFIYSYNPAAGALMEKKFTTGLGYSFSSPFFNGGSRLDFDASFKVGRNNAFGVALNNNVYGLGVSYSAYLGLQYSRAFRLNEKLRLSVGLQGDYVQKVNYLEKESSVWEGYYYKVANYPNLNAGIMLKHERYYLGLTFQQILPWLSPLKGESFQTYFTGAYTFRVNPNLSFTPNVLAFTDYFQEKHHHLHYIQTNFLMNYKWVEIGPNLMYQKGDFYKFSEPITLALANRVSYGGQLGVRIAKNLLLGYAYEREQYIDWDLSPNYHYFYLRFR